MNHWLAYFLALKAMHHFYTSAWDAFLCNLNHFDFNCQHKVFYPKIGYFCLVFIFKYVKGFSSSPALSLVTKTNTQTSSYRLSETKLFCLLFHLNFDHFLMFQVPLNHLSLQQISLFISHLFLPSAFLHYLSPPFLSHLWKKACSKLSSARQAILQTSQKNVYQLLQLKNPTLQQSTRQRFLLRVSS